jgi:ribosome maturation factor RimP
MDKGLIISKIREIAERAAGESGLELVHVEMAGTNRDSVVRIYIDKEGGVGLDDCSSMSQRVESVLDAEDPIPGRYVLEVSSPGIERQLYSLRDFERFAGHLAKVKSKTEVDGQKVFVGQIGEVDGGTVTIEDRTRGTVVLSYDDIVKANLKIDLAQEFRGPGRK